MYITHAPYSCTLCMFVHACVPVHTWMVEHQGSGNQSAVIKEQNTNSTYVCMYKVIMQVIDCSLTKESHIII